MQLIHTMKLSLIFSIVILLVIGFLLPSNISAIDINEDDGIWSDSFVTAGTVDFRDGTSSCIWKEGTIQLASAAGQGLTYNFRTGNNKAYNYQFFISNQILFSLISPLIYTPRLLINNSDVYEFDNTFQYPFIENKSEDINRFASSYTTGQNPCVVQHFRIKLQGDADDIGNLFIRWYGKAENAKQIEIFYLKYVPIKDIPLIKKWERIFLAYNTSDISFYYELNQDKVEQAIGMDNYIDICVVATKESPGNLQCELDTDYIELQSKQQKGYKIGYGYVLTRNPISLASNAYWELFTWDDFETNEATVRYQILYKKNNEYVPIANSILKGNEEGFTKSPIFLSPLADDYPEIKIRAKLTTTDSSMTPKIFSWTLTWQTLDHWHDLFSSEYRIDTKNQIDVENGVNISFLTGDWPMFSQNPENTRVSTGKVAYTKNPYWYSTYHVPNTNCSNLVVDNNALYVPVINKTTGKGSLYKYSPFVIDSDDIGKPYDSSQIKDFSSLNGKKIIGSPAISDDYVIVATGDTNTNNYVYAFDKDIPSKGPIWTFDFSTYTSSDKKICYWGSPIIADGKVFLTSWSGRPDDRKADHVNNMILALDLSNGELIWNETFPSPTSVSLLKSPTWSFSTPAYSKGKVVVGCKNNQSSNLFAFDKDGNLLWNQSIGSIGKASPVIYNNTVYVINEQNVFYGIQKQTKVTAVNIDDGSIRWEKELGQVLITVHNIDIMGLAQSTPAISNGVLYATSPDGSVTALDLSKNGTVLWNKTIYSIGFQLDAPILTSSPTYADGILYVGTPNGILYALNTTAKGQESWHQMSFPRSTPIVTDPVITNGLLFFGTGDGKLYVYGKYIASSQQMNGGLTSIPIQLPEGVGWNKFHATVKNLSTNVNKITFSLFDANNNFIKYLQNGSVIDPGHTVGRTLRLHADFWAKNNSFNPKLISWNITFYTDKTIPFIDMNTLTPNPQGWLNKIITQFTVKVKDNDSGLLVNSARYEIGYTANNNNYLKDFTAQCTGSNGTTSLEQITIDIAKLDFYKNITSLRSLRINITDLAGNTATKYIIFKQDTTKPISYVNKTLMKLRYNATAKYMWINATSFDNGTDASGIKQVKLYYRYSSTGTFTDDWIYLTNSTQKSPHWKFNFTNYQNQSGGYFELCTIAIDYAGNNEEFPVKGDVSFLYDWIPPNLPSFSGETTFWFKERSTYSVVFKDDFRLDIILYRPNFENSWTTIATNVNASTYDKPWSLTEEYWDKMNEGEFYYLYFKINDTLGNTLLVTSNNQAITIRKDTSAPIGTIDIPSLDTETSSSYNFTVSGFVNDQDGSGIKEVSLYYRFSKDKSNWSSWTEYGDLLKSSPYEWKYSATDGEGYYEFKIHVTDVAGNTMESEVFPVIIISFPITLILVMICLAVVLCLLSVIIFIKYRKTKVT